jgi:pilus assembly protein CpaF
MINGPTDVWIERKGKVSKTDATFTEEGLIGAARNMAQFVGRLLNDERPRLDARLPDGSRIHVVIPPIARKGTTISIRKFFKDKLTIESLIKFKSMTPQMARLIDAGIHTKLNMLVSGGTGSGKTTLLNALSSFIDPGERVVTIEDAAELRLRQPQVLRLEARPPNLEGRGEVTIRRLVKNALRMRPDRIVVGEVRGPEALDMLTALATGHDGSLCTVHAGSAAEALRRLETLALMADVGLPHAAIREQVADAIDLVVCQARAADGSRRVTGVSEVVRVAGGAAAREIYSLGNGRATWRAPLGEGMAARLAGGGAASGAPEG